MFRVSPDVEKERIEKVKAFRTQRDNDKTTAALKALRDAVERMKNDWPGSCGQVMPVMVDAFRAQCTIGEAQGILKDVLGYGYTGHG